jgi:hypothetical protein
VFHVVETTGTGGVRPERRWSFTMLLRLAFASTFVFACLFAACGAVSHVGGGSCSPANCTGCTRCPTGWICIITRKKHYYTI